MADFKVFIVAIVTSTYDESRSRNSLKPKSTDGLTRTPYFPSLNAGKFTFSLELKK